MNNVSITGRITRMIDSKSTDGYTILNFSIADNKTAKQTGRSQFFNCVIFRQGADTMKKSALNYAVKQKMKLLRKKNRKTHWITHHFQKISPKKLLFKPGLALPSLTNI